jgi:hypothetical protein
MTVSAQTAYYSYTGDGVSKIFPFPSRFLTDEDLKVAVNETFKTLNVDYTVTGAGINAGGNVVFANPPPGGQLVELVRDPAISQLLDIVNSQTLLDETLERAFDKLTMILQAQRRRADDAHTRIDVLDQLDVSAAAATAVAAAASAEEDRIAAEAARNDVAGTLRFRTRANAQAYPWPSAPEDLHVAYYDDTNLMPIKELFRKEGTFNNNIPGQLPVTVGATTFYYTPQDALIRPENLGSSKFDGTGVNDRNIIEQCLIEQRRTKKTIKLGGRERHYAFTTALQHVLVAGQSVDIRGDGCLIRPVDAAGFLHYLFNLRHNPNVTGYVKMLVEGLRFDANGKSTCPFVIDNVTAGSAFLSEIDVQDIEILPSNAYPGANIYGMFLQGRCDVMSARRIQVGRLTKASEATYPGRDGSNIYMGRGAPDDYAKNIILEDFSVGGVFYADQTEIGDADSVKVYGQLSPNQGVNAPFDGTESITISRGDVVCGVSRGLKMQADAPEVDRVTLRHRAGNFTSNAGDVTVGFDFQFGGGSLRNSRVVIESDNIGFTSIAACTSRPYGRKSKFVMDNIEVVQPAANANEIYRLLFRFPDTATSPQSSIHVSNINAPNSVFKYLVFDVVRNNDNENPTTTRNNSTTLENVFVKSVTRAAVRWCRDGGTVNCRGNVIVSNLRQEGADVPAVVQTNGIADAQSVVPTTNVRIETLIPHRGFTSPPQNYQAGTLTVPANSDNVNVVFDPPAKDTNYDVVVRAVSQTGAPPAGALLPLALNGVSNRTVNGFTLTVQSNTGAGNTVTFEYTTVRKH